MPEGGQEEGSEERERWEKWRSNKLLPGLGRAEGKHVDECAGEYSRVTNGLHYQRKTLQGSDLIGTCEGVAVVPAQNKWNNTSGDCTSSEKHACKSAPSPAEIQRAVLTHSLLHVVPQFSLNEVFTVFWQRKSQAAKEQSQSCRLKNNLVAFLPVNTNMT